jgi:hypothetical protein
MKESLVAAIGIWLVFVLVFVSLVGEQTGQAPVPTSNAAPIAKAEVSGKIKSVDPAGGAVLLEDGTRLMFPGSVDVNSAALKAGATVKASIEERGGQKVVTAIQVN